MEKVFITPLQMALLAVMSRIVVPIVFLPDITSTYALQDTWIGSMLASGIGLFLTWLSLNLARHFPEETIIQYAPKLIGRWLGTLLSFTLIFFYFFIFALSLRQFSEFVVNSIMPETPIEVFMFGMALTVLYGVRTGLETIARANAFVITVVLLSITLVLLLATPEMDFTNLLPILDAPLLEILESGAVSGSWYGEIVILLMLYPTVNIQKKLPTFLYSGVVISTLVTLSIVISCISIFGPGEAHLQTYPFFSLVKIISVGDIIERIESINLAIWIACIYLKSCLFLYCAIEGLAQIFKLNDPRPFSSPLTFLGVFTGIFLFHNFAELRAFLDFGPWMIFSGLFSLIIPGFLLLLAIVKKKLQVSK